MAWVGKLAGNAARCYDMGDDHGYGLAISPTTPKNVWPAVQINSISAPTFSSSPWDPSSNTITRNSTLDANTWWISGSCDTANASLSFLMVYFDNLDTVMTVGPSYTVSTSSAYLINSTSRYPLFGVLIWDSFQAASSFGVIVASLSAGSWNLQFNFV